MLVFLLYTILFLFANACFVRIAYILIQPGQLFGGWQHVLNRMHDANSTLLNALAKPFGDCVLCWSHMWSAFWFIAYCLFMHKVVGQWVTDSSAVGAFWAYFFNIVWYLIYVSVATSVSTYFITRKAKY